jgi:hypothetical protein
MALVYEYLIVPSRVAPYETTVIGFDRKKPRWGMFCTLLAS